MLQRLAACIEQCRRDRPRGLARDAGGFCIKNGGAAARAAIGPAAPKASIELPPDSAPVPPCAKRIIAGIGQQIDAHPIRLGFRLALQPPAFAELGQHAKMRARRLQPRPVVENIVRQLVRDDNRKCGIVNPVQIISADLDDIAVRRRAGIGRYLKPGAARGHGLHGERHILPSPPHRHLHWCRGRQRCHQRLKRLDVARGGANGVVRQRGRQSVPCKRHHPVIGSNACRVGRRPWHDALNRGWRGQAKYLPHGGARRALILRQRVKLHAKRRLQDVAQHRVARREPIADARQPHIVLPQQAQKRRRWRAFTRSGRRWGRQHHCPDNHNPPAGHLPVISVVGAFVMPYRSAVQRGDRLSRYVPHRNKSR